MVSHLGSSFGILNRKIRLQSWGEPTLTKCSSVVSVYYVKLLTSTIVILFGTTVVCPFLVKTEESTIRAQVSGSKDRRRFSSPQILLFPVPGYGLNPFTNHHVQNSRDNWREITKKYTIYLDLYWTGN